MEADLVASEPLGITGTVKPFVVLQDNWHAFGETRDRFKNSSTNLHVFAYLGELLVGQLARLVEKAFRHPDLPDVVKQAAAIQNVNSACGSPTSRAISKAIAVTRSE